ncbi:MAG: hypothetical protein GY824_05255 [Delftia sp.]|nr:hypothetical protein [Delftia sp.]
MKLRTAFLIPLAAGSLLLAGNALAQDQSQSPPTSDTTSTTFNSPKGQVTINSQPAAVPDAGPAPDFATLSGGKKSITEAQAAAYPPLANDFEYADSNRNGSISKAEYQRWVKQMH